ncbi:MAG: type III pantothenate kinase [Deltaproteobacteria bacterium]|nr:type III pantothenate kinase [Deltaproteobacteria bacterium]
MLLTVDIGNSNIVIGVFEQNELLHQFRLRTDKEQTEDGYAALLLSLLRNFVDKDLKFTNAVVCSVVPVLTSVIVNTIEKLLNVTCLVVGPGIKSGISIHVDDPRSVGADRIVNAIATKKLYGTPALVIDFGTATTFDFIGEKGSYEGGIIAPGLVISTAALVQAAAKLPQIEFNWPETVVGRNTVAAMQSGTMLGYACMVEGLVKEIEKEQGKIKYIIATGGVGNLMKSHIPCIQTYDPTLTLKGMQIIAEINFCD